MARLDLHIHSSYSDDGEFSVPELLRLGQQAELDYLAITDHNTVRGVAEALALAPQMGLGAISGVELDCIHQGRNFHLLGYHFDHAQPIFAEIEQSVFSQEQSTAEQKIALIQEIIGIPISAQQVLDAAGEKVVTGELIAEILLKTESAQENEALRPYLPGGVLSTNPYVNFYWDFFSQGKPAYTPIEYISLTQGVELLHRAGGVAVLAHPAQNLKGDYQLLEQIIEIGIDGIEAYSSYHGRIEAAFFEEVAQKHNLLITCGSDFHGKTKPAISLCGHRADKNMPHIAEALKQRGILD